MNLEQSNRRREAGMLVLGLILGGLFGIVSGLWTAYYVEWLKSTFQHPDWTTTLILSSILLIALFVFLFIWARKQLS